MARMVPPVLSLAKAAARAMLLAAATTHAAPRRVVALNPCADALVLAIAAPGQIAALSALGHRADAASAPVAQVRRYPAIGDGAEAVLRARADVVVTTLGQAPATIAVLRRLGVRVLALPLPQSLAEVRAIIRATGAALGRGAAAETLVRNLDAAIGAAAPPAGARPVETLLLQAGGLTASAGTLPDDLMRAAGLANAAQRYGIRGWGVVSLERVVRAPPRLILAGDAGADRVLGHPVLHALPATIMRYPARLLQCGGPVVIDALRVLADARERAR